MKLTRFHISVFLGLAALIWYIVLRLQGTTVTWEHGRPFSVVVGVLVLFGLALEHVIWRWPLIPGWFVARPDLRGTWRVTLQSTYIDPGTSERPPPRTCYMGVKQTLSTLQMQLLTAESKSVFVANNIRPNPSGVGFQIIGVYTNEPNVHLRDEGISAMHQGALLLETHGPRVKPHSLTAKYWTDQKTTGTMIFDQRLDRVFTSYVDAEQAFAE